MGRLRAHIQRRRRAEEGVAYARGKHDGLLAARPFGGIAGLVRFPEVYPPHAAVIQYERELLDALPRAYASDRIAQRRDELDRDHVSDPVADNSVFRAADATRDDLVRELERVRQWLDAFVRSAEEYAAARPLRRGQILPPALPRSASEYESVEAFVAENRERGVPDWETRKVAEGADFGYDWTWQDPRRPWVISTWRVSYIDELKEVYACENTPTRRVPFVSFDGEDERPRAVWLLASDFEYRTTQEPSEDDEWWPSLWSFSPTWELLSDLQRRLMPQRNSLVLLAEALVEAQGETSSAEGPGAPGTE